MHLEIRPGALVGFLLLGLPLASQSIEEVLKHMPATALRLEVYPRPAAMDRKGLLVGKRFDASGSWVGLKAKTGLDVAQLTGPLVMGNLPGNEGGEVTVVFAPVKNPRAILTQLKAKAVGQTWTFTLPASKATKGAERVWYGAPQGSLLLLTSDAATLQSIQSSPKSLAPEWATLLPELHGHDATLVVTEQGTAGLLQVASEGLKKGVAPRANLPGVDPANLAMARAMAEGVEQWLVKAQSSVRHFVMTLDLMPSGALKMSGRATFRAGSPLQTEFAALPKPSFHPLGALPAGGFALASGGQWPAALGGLSQWMVKAMDTPGGPLTPELRERWAKASEGVFKPVQSFHYAFSAPSKPGDPLFSQLLMLMKVTDAAAYRDASVEAALIQNEVLKSLGQAGAVTVQKDVIPGVPSWTVSLDLASLAGTKLPPAQFKMATSLLFGGDAIRFSYGEALPSTMVGVFGGASELDAAIRRVKAGPDLASAPMVSATDRLLPASNRFGLYLSAKGVRDLAQRLAKSILGPEAPHLPELADHEPAALSVTLDGEALGFHLAAPASALDGTAQLVKAMAKAFKTMPGSGPKGRGKAAK